MEYAHVRSLSVLQITNRLQHHSVHTATPDVVYRCREGAFTLVDIFATRLWSLQYCLHSRVSYVNYVP